LRHEQHADHQDEDGARADRNAARYAHRQRRRFGGTGVALDEERADDRTERDRSQPRPALPAMTIATIAAPNAIVIVSRSVQSARASAEHGLRDDGGCGSG